MKKTDLYWLAGLLEGEGCFGTVRSPSNRPSIALQMCDEDVVTRAAELMGGYAIHKRKVAKAYFKPAYHVLVRGAAAADLMREIRPLMGERRGAAIDKALAAYRPRKPTLTQDEARELAAAYHAGYRHPTRLGLEYGISKNHAIHFINRFRPGS